MFNPCCCTCIEIGRDVFNRADNSDITVNATLAYSDVSSGWSIASNELAVDSSLNELTLPILDAANLDRQVNRISVVDGGSSGSLIGTEASGYQFKYEPGTTYPRSFYDPDGNLVLARKTGGIGSVQVWGFGIGSVTGLTGGDENGRAFLCEGISLGHTTVTSSVTVGTFWIPYSLASDTPVVKLLGRSPDVAFDGAFIHEDYQKRSDKGAVCVPLLISPATYDAVFTYGSSGSNLDTLAGSVSYPSGTVMQIGSAGTRVTDKGLLKYRGKGVRVSAGTALTNGLTTLRDVEVWLDAGQVGVVITEDGGGGYNLDVYDGGISIDTQNFTPGTNDRWILVVAERDDGLFVALRTDNGATQTVHVFSVYEIAKADAWPEVEFGHIAGSADRVELQMGEVAWLGDNYNGRFAGFIPADWTGNELCTGTAPLEYEVTLDQIAGDCAGDLNGTTTVVVAPVGSPFHVRRNGAFYSSMMDSCAGRIIFRITTLWFWTEYESSPFRQMFHITYGRSWAIFEKRWSTRPTCNDFNDTALSLVDFHNAEGIEWDAATCVVDV